MGAPSPAAPGAAPLSVSLLSLWSWQHLLALAGAERRGTGERTLLCPCQWRLINKYLS